ncbi:hypothetical protein VZT92_011041 [Zoarces viviparus]|uniref:Uncharacterized protein n=1 Tax=Zoarces viviparus TaxID=48416 RepID=A0AAW1FB70_ZOAVI
MSLFISSGLDHYPLVPTGVQNSEEGPFEWDFILDVGAGRVVLQAYGVRSSLCQGQVTVLLQTPLVKTPYNHIHHLRVGHCNRNKDKDWSVNKASLDSDLCSQEDRT